MKNKTIPVRLELNVLDTVPFGSSADNNVSFHALTLELPSALTDKLSIWEYWKAGQFVMIRPAKWNNEILWGRAFSIARVTKRGLVLFIQSIGKGTKEIAKLMPNDKVVVWGPLGTSFAAEADTPTLLLAGGIGIVPFCGYMDQHPRPANLHMLFGHRHSVNCYPIDSIAQHIEVEDFHELTKKDLPMFLNAVRDAVKDYASKKGLVLACGPMPFLKYVWNLSKEYNVRTQLSLENKMACGVGACLGCVAKVSEKWTNGQGSGLPVQTCTSGPVFWAETLDLND